MESYEPQLLSINIFEKTNNFINKNNNLLSDRYIYSAFESRPAIDVQNVDFGYNKKTVILNNITIKIPKGLSY